MWMSVMCTAALFLAQAPASDAPPPLAGEAAATASPTENYGDNPPPPMYDPVAEEASAQRDVLIRRVLTWTAGAIGAVGLALGALGVSVVTGGVASWLWANRVDDKNGTNDAHSPFKLAGNALLALGAIAVVLGAPAAALGSVWFVMSWPLTSGQ